jgi:F0F1-type ATP synthase membrane subunit b/b'
MRPDQLNLNPMGMIEPVVIVAVILIIIATYFALRRFFVMPYLHMLETREQLIETANGQRLEAETCTREAADAAEKAVAGAAAEAEQIRSEARERAEDARRVHLEAASSAASALLEEGRARIAADRERERERMRAEAIECVGLACRQLIGDVDADAVATTVDRLLARQAQ